MAARVQVVVEAKDESSGILRGITAQFGQFGALIESITGSSINWGNVTQQAVTLVVDAMKASISATQEYAAEVRDLSLASGATAEEASRLIQVLDDYEITAQDITAATKALTKNGLAPNIETIASLSDQYLSLNTAQERNEFILQNLGRAGLEWANALSQGGDALLALNEDVNANLILTEESLRQAEEYRLALDSWNDSVQALKIAIGSEMLPILTDLINNTMDSTEAMQLAADAGMNWVTMSASQRQAFLDQASASRIATDQMEDLAAASDAAGNAAKNSVPDYVKQLDMMKKLTGATQEQINSLAYLQLQQSLSEGGITEEEFNLLIDAGVAMGQFTEESGNAAREIGDLNRLLADGYIDVATYTNALNNIPRHTEIEIHTIYTQEGTPPVGLGGGGGTGAGGSGTSSGPIPTFSGGEVYAGEAYIVGERGQEPFIPSQNGRVLGHAESLHALSMGGGGSNIFYGNVTLQIDGETANDIMSYQ